MQNATLDHLVILEGDFLELPVDDRLSLEWRGRLLDLGRQAGGCGGEGRPLARPQPGPAQPAHTACSQTSHHSAAALLWSKIEIR